MAVIRDVIPQLELFQPTSADDALALLAAHGSDAWVYAGGLDTLDWFKDRVKRPRVVVDLGGVESLREIRSTGGGVELGAMARLADVINHPDVRSQFPALAYAARSAASPQIRNQGTIGGNVSQDTRCWYYRDGWTCYRAGGNICYASPPTAMNREHCILGASRCVAVNPSDTAPVLVALEAEMVVRRGTSERVVAAEEFFVGPEIDIERMTVLEPEDLLTAIRVPSTWAGARVYFEKVRDRDTWDFPLVNVATAIQDRGGTIQDARVVVNGVAPTPVRLTAVENALRGQARNEQLAERAGNIAIQGVSPLTHNGFKVNLLKNLVKRSIRDEPMSV
ncbi:MAG: xanthine dehydrogenase family protein subunit M [Vicinamibacterales bacterium]|jgi:xanthine dehydrogenase YagS FAD-binding subunit|nr:xanthine dehydrogenase family protein subunit M [Vicinamibacterales bacterium]MDP7477817.1 xanthine dehydrogenase family protein subunit M [Vicinamibacterales bacterium]MDP7693420.1 xanthine dehydrogenase family protein subunit M [Vicinamibacterales bacterium]HJN46541.1 xanthine dehydrogenase family protein subunit M [Vicinamibacterales bacterium]